MCRVLEVSTSGYYDWLGRRPSERSRGDHILLQRISGIHQASRETYGAPRVHVELREDHGVRCGRKRVARIMRAAGIKGCHRRRRHWLTKRDQSARPAPDLVERKFEALEPNLLWTADITYVPTSSGPLYLAVVLDVFSRAVVGWSMRTDLSGELVTTRGETATSPGAIRATRTFTSRWRCGMRLTDALCRASRSWSLWSAPTAMRSVPMSSRCYGIR